MLGKLPSQVIAVQWVIMKPNGNVYSLWNSLQHPCVPVLVWAAFTHFCSCWCCMQQRQWWLGVVLCLWSNASARAQYIWVRKMRTRKLSVRRGWSWAKGENTGSQTHKYTPTGIHAYSATELYPSSIIWLVLINQVFWKRDHIGGQLLCSTPVQWWHHSVWDRASIFSLRQSSVVAASRAPIQGLAQTVSLGMW